MDSISISSHRHCTSHRRSILFDALQSISFIHHQRHTLLINLIMDTTSLSATDSPPRAFMKRPRHPLKGLIINPTISSIHNHHQSQSIRRSDPFVSSLDAQTRCRGQASTSKRHLDVVIGFEPLKLTDRKGSTLRDPSPGTCSPVPIMPLRSH